LRALRAPMHPKLLGFVIPVAVAELGNVVLQKADFFILGFFVSSSELAVYAASEFLGRIAANVRYAFDNVAAPVLAEALHLGDRERLRYNLALMSRWVATLTLPLAITMIALRHQALSLYGPGFVTGTSLVCLWTVTHMLNGCLGLSGHVLTMSGRSRIYLTNQLVAASLNVGLSLLLIPRLGLLGGAISALVAVNGPLVATLLEVWALEHVHPFDRQLAKPVLAAAGALLVQLTIAHFLATGPLAVATIVIAGLATYVTLLTAFRLGREEREILGRLWQRFRRR
jgi:O-antigen/teichoic acid export membrane protein